MIDKIQLLEMTSTISTWAKKKSPVLSSCEEYMTLKKLKSLKIVIEL